MGYKIDLRNEKNVIVSLKLENRRTSRLTTSNKTLLIFFLRPFVSSLTLIDLSRRPHFYQFNPVRSPRKSLPGLKRKRNERCETTGWPERNQPRMSQPRQKRDDTENFGGNQQEGWRAGVVGGKCRKVERLASTRARFQGVRQPEIYHRPDALGYASLCA